MHAVSPTFRHRLLHIAGPLLGVGVLALALKALHEELRAYHYRDIVRQLESLPPERLGLAVGFVALSYAVLTGYDGIALRYVGKALRWRVFGPAAFIATAVSNNVGLPWLTGGSVRLRFYTSHGLSTAEVTQVVGYISLSFWVGFLGLAGTLFTVMPPAIPPGLHLPAVGPRLVGVLFLGAVALYVGLVFLRRRPVHFRGREVAMPAPHHLIWQLLVTAGDWTLAAATLFVLLPPEHGVPYQAVLGAFLVAQMAGLISHVPGGVGVFETVVLLFLSDRVPKPVLLGTLVVYRALFYLLPFAVAVVLLGVYEVRHRRAQVRRLAGSAGQWVSEVLPSVFAPATFALGVLLLIASVTPTPEARLVWLHQFIPLPVLEAAHLLGGLAGAALLLLARGLQQRLSRAVHLTEWALRAGVVAALLGSGDGLTAAPLAVLLGLLRVCRADFPQPGSPLREPFTAGWGLAIFGALAACTWLGFFIYKHEPPSGVLLGRFVLLENAPRSLRVCVGAAAVALLFAVAHLLRPRAPERDRPS